MKLTVVMHTCREDNSNLPAPVLEMMIDSLNRQVYDGEFELIIVDLLYERRIGAVQNVAVHSEGYPVLHIPDKPSPFKDESLLRIATPKNTGVLFARGTHVIFTDDCQVLPEDALARAAHWAQRGAGCTMAYEKRLWRQGKDDHITGVDQRGPSLGIPEGKGQIQPPRNIGFLGGTMSMLPIEAVLDVNGFDEMFDGSRQLEDADMIIRLTSLGQTMAFDNGQRIIEYECGNYGPEVSTEPIKCNGAYAQYVWSLIRTKANTMKGEVLAEAIRRMQWDNCLRLDKDKPGMCTPHMSPCTKLGDQELLERIYNDQRLTFDLREMRKRLSWENAHDFLMG